MGFLFAIYVLFLFVPPAIWILVNCDGYSFGYWASDWSNYELWHLETREGWMNND